VNGAEAVAVLEGIGAHLVLRPDGMIDVTAPEVPELDAAIVRGAAGDVPPERFPSGGTPSGRNSVSGKNPLFQPARSGPLPSKATRSARMALGGAP